MWNIWIGHYKFHTGAFTTTEQGLFDFHLWGSGAADLLSATEGDKANTKPVSFENVARLLPMYIHFLCVHFFIVFIYQETLNMTIQETGDASQAVKAAQDVLKDIRMVFSEKSQKDKADKAAAKAAAVPKAKPGAKKRANGKQADV